MKLIFFVYLFLTVFIPLDALKRSCLTCYNKPFIAASKREVKVIVSTNKREMNCLFNNMKRLTSRSTIHKKYKNVCRPTKLNGFYKGT